MAEPFLRTADFHTEVWKRLEEILESRLRLARDQIDQPQHEDVTNRLRGRIEEIKYLLALPAYLQRQEDQANTIELGDISAMY